MNLKTDLTQIIFPTGTYHISFENENDFKRLENITNIYSLDGMKLSKKVNKGTFNLVLKRNKNLNQADINGSSDFVSYNYSGYIDMECKLFLNDSFRTYEYIKNNKKNGIYDENPLIKVNYKVSSQISHI